MASKTTPQDADPKALAQLQKLSELGLMTSALMHELKQPLAAVKGYAQMLRESCGAAAAEQIGQMLAQLERIERLAANHRRLLQRDGPRERLDLCAVSATAARLLEPRVRQAGAELSLRLPDVPVFVEAAEGELLQVLVNLLANAIDAVAGCSRRAVELRLAPGECPEIVVADSGGGISPTLASRLFTPFFTTKGPDAGTGLGLFISRQLAEQNGARLELAADARPAPFRTAFRLRFGPAEAAPRPARRTVLVVDDEESICSMLASLLEPEGLEVLQALSGEEALELLGKRDFDLVLCDKNLPGVNGLEIARAARQRLPACPVILMTGYPSLETAQQGLEIGLLDYLEKPFDDIAEVRRRVREALAPSARTMARPRTRRVLVIEDRQDEAVRFGEAAAAAGGLPLVVPGVDEARAQLESTGGADVVVLSLDLRGRAISLAAIRTLRERAAGGLIVVGDHPSLEQTIAAIRVGAAACLPRSLATADRLTLELSRLLRPV